MGRREQLRYSEERKTKKMYVDMLQDQLSDMPPLRRKATLKVNDQQSLIRERYLERGRASRV